MIQKVRSEMTVETKSHIMFRNSIDDFSKNDRKEEGKLGIINPFTFQSEKKIDSYGKKN